jgi:glycogen operon protein
MLLAGNAIEEVDERGEPVMGDSLLVLLNAHDDKVPFAFPSLDPQHQWQRVIDTYDPAAPEESFKAGAKYPLQGRSVAVFKVIPPLRDRRRAATPQQSAAAEPAPPEPALPVVVET